MLPICDIHADHLQTVLSYDPPKFAADLQAFAKLNEQRLYKLMKTCMDVQTDLKGLVKAMVSSIYAYERGLVN